MSETNSRNFLDQTTPPPRSTGDAADKTIDMAGNALFERLGVGGMGEVYRFGDDALQRDLAIKVLKAELRGNADAEERFLREARLAGSLQHPGVVPIHQLGQLADGRACYTMKLVRGRTLADLLHDEPEGPERLPRLLAILEKVCQAVAYAHSKRVIHRDLKPANVMVGEFGEVQVMDWGLAKELTNSERAPSAEPTESVETAAWTEEGAGLSRAGSALGTPAYMPPEQAAGDWDIVDERADVFALGAILCEMLTGQPPYHGANRDDLLRRARRGDMAEALGQLGKCTADVVLVDLCRECLAADRAQRPRHAAMVAERVATYEAEVQERLRRAELERVAADARAAVETERAREAQARVKAERQAKRRTLALAAALVVLLAGGGGWLWWWKLKQDRADGAALTVLEHGREKLDEGWRWHDLAMLGEAKAETDRAADIARGGVSDAVEQQVADFRTVAEERLDRAGKNRDLLTALVDIATPHETKTYKVDKSGQKLLELAEPSVEEQYAAAFRRRWPDIDIEKEAESAVAARLQEEPEVVLQGVIAGLDGWVMEQRRQKRAEAKWRHLLGIVELLDHSEPRRQLRALLTGAVPPRAQDVAGLLGGHPPWFALWKLGRGNEWWHLRQLRGRMDVTSEPVLTVLLLAQASSEVGDVAGAEEVLRLALARRPDEVALLDALGKVLERQGGSRRAEAIGCYRAARAKNPALGVALGKALGNADQAAECEAIFRDLLRQQPSNPEILCYVCTALFLQKEYTKMETLGQKVIALKPDYARAYFLLGGALYSLEKFADAEAAFRKSTDLDPNDAVTYYILGALDGHLGRHAEGEAALRKSIALRPDNAEAYSILGVCLNAREKYAEAETAYRKAIALKPDDAEVYKSLGAVLTDHQGKHVEAEAVFRKAIELKPDDAEVYHNLGIALRNQGKLVESEAAFRKSIALKPDDAGEYNQLGFNLLAQGKHAEAEAAYRKSITLKSDDADAYKTLGLTLLAQGKNAEAETAFRKAVALKQDDSEAYSQFGAALLVQGKLADAEAAFRKTITLKPDHAGDYLNLGSALGGQRKYAEAEAVYRKAIALKPDYSEAYIGLGNTLSGREKHAEAETAYRKAIALKPDDVQPVNNLGMFLNGRKKYAEAEAVYRKFIALHPDDAEAYYNLGKFLNGQEKHTEAEVAYRKAIALKPDYAEAYDDLSTVLNQQGRPAEAEAAYRKVIALKPDSADSYLSLGDLLHSQGKHVKAEAAFRKAIALKPDYAEAHCNLGHALQGQGHYTESLAAFRRGHELGSKQPDWQYPSIQWVRTGECLVGLEKKLPAILQGEASPARVDDTVILAWMCQQPYHKRYAASARLYADAFAAEPEPAADLYAQHRYNAACSAALAAGGQSEDTRLLPDKVAVMFRRWALHWLRDDLSAYSKSVEQNKSDANKAIQKQLTHWRSDPDLGSVRDSQALERLPENERASWQLLWRDVDELLKRVSKKIGPITRPNESKKPQTPSLPLSRVTGR